MPDRISNYRQIRLTLTPHEGDWDRANWSVIAVDVRKGVPHSQAWDQGLILIGSEPPSRSDFWAALAQICAEQSRR